MKDLLRVDEISKSYANHQALDRVSLKVREGTIFGLLGPNGAGKTTLIRIITQIIQADSGKIWIDGDLLNANHIKEVGYLPEERGLYKKMKVGEQLLYLARIKGLSKSEAMERIKYWFKRFDIADWWGKNVEDLSKGMGQKVQFIATVMHNPKLIILDEPFSGFDPINANLIKDEILELQRQGSTIIFSTHRMESVEELCDHIALINNAHVVLSGNKTEIQNSFRNAIYTVVHDTPLAPEPDVYVLESSDSISPGQVHSVIKAVNGTASNDLLKHLMNRTAIIKFEEKVPNMNEIFIRAVNNPDLIEPQKN
jgi:ABC-2 type transport system ATP-binding protein